LFPEKSAKRNVYFFLAIYLLLWVILFEFIFPVNKILPKPSIVILSFRDLWHVYNFGINFLSTFSIIIISIILAYFLVWLLKTPLIKGRFIYSFITSLEWFSNYIPGIIIGLLLILWFPDFEYTDLIFVFTTALFSFIIEFKKEIKSVKQEYIDAVRSLGANEKFIAKKVVWKSIEPGLFNHIFELHFYLWTVLLVFEYIKGAHGLGSVIKLSIQFNDLSAFFTTLIIIGVTIFVLVLLLKFIQKKYYFWESA
jgi:ABC-type nitrate/sulfonate/bicarbonate transport system permease component